MEVFPGNFMGLWLAGQVLIASHDPFFDELGVGKDVRFGSFLVRAKLGGHCQSPRFFIGARFSDVRMDSSLPAEERSEERRVLAPRALKPLYHPPSLDLGQPLPDRSYLVDEGLGLRWTMTGERIAGRLEVTELDRHQLRPQALLDRARPGPVPTPIQRKDAPFLRKSTFPAAESKGPWGVVVEPPEQQRSFAEKHLGHVPPKHRILECESLQMLQIGSNLAAYRRWQGNQSRVVRSIVDLVPK